MALAFRARRIPLLTICVVVAVAMAVLALCLRQPLFVAVFAFIAIVGVRASAVRTVPSREDAVRGYLSVGFARMQRGDARNAIAIATVALLASGDRAVRSDAVRLLSYAYLVEGSWAPLMSLLETEAHCLNDEELAKFELAARELRHQDEAVRIAALRVSSARCRSRKRI